MEQIPASVKFEDVEALFKGELGFVSFRTVRRMCFVDFQNERQATTAMRKYQGHTFGDRVPVSGRVPTGDRGSNSRAAVRVRAPPGQFNKRVHLQRFVGMCSPSVVVAHVSYGAWSTACLTLLHFLCGAY